MCAAIEAMRNESETKGRDEGGIEGRIEGRNEGRIEDRNEGRIEGRIEGEITGAVKTCKKFNMPIQETIRYIAREYSLPLQQAEEKTKKYWQ